MSKSTTNNNFKFITIKNLILACLLLATVSVNAQVGIGIPVPDASSQLDVTSSDKGVLIPRMLATARTSIASPAIGLLGLPNRWHSRFLLQCGYSRQSGLGIDSK